MVCSLFMKTVVTPDFLQSSGLSLSSRGLRYNSSLMGVVAKVLLNQMAESDKKD